MSRFPNQQPNMMGGQMPNMMGQQMQMGQQMPNQMQMGGQPMQMGRKVQSVPMQMGGQMPMQMGGRQPMQMQMGQQVPMQQMKMGNQMMGQQMGQMQGQMMGQMNQMMGQMGQMQGQMMGQMGQMMGGFVDPLLPFFQQVDTDKSGQIDAKELVQALKLSPGKLSVSVNTAKSLIKMFQNKAVKQGGQYMNVMSIRTKSLSFLEFKACYTYITQLQNFFFQVDSDRSGSLSDREMFKACKLSGYNLDYTTFSKVFKGYAGKGKTLTLSQYFEICVFLATVLKQFQKRAGGKKKKAPSSTATFTFAQLVAVCTQIKF